MAENERFDESVSKWLEETAPGGLPERVLNATFERTRTSRQHVGWRALLRRSSMPKFLPALGSATVILVVAALALSFYVNRQGDLGALPSPNPSADATVAASPSVEPAAPSPTPSNPTATGTATSATAAPATSEPPTAASPHVFTAIAPGEFVAIPDWPLDERTSPPTVWTGTELIVWGDGTYGLAGDGAAFHLANGTWRVIAEAPISPRSEHAATWTGSEMIVWGGRVENSFYYDGAAYNPVTDTWRPLPPAPAFFGKDPSMIWIGDEAVVFGVAGNSERAGEYIAAAAYDPVADSWRALADAPPSVRVDGGLWWTGESIITANVGLAGAQTEPSVGRLARYDVAADSWTVSGIGSSSAVVGVTGPDGRVDTFINLPSEIGVGARLIDSNGSLVAELPAFPGDRDVFGELVQAYGLWVGDEAVFEIWADRSDAAPEQIWALEPATQTWHRLDADTEFPRIDPGAVAVGDLLFTWNRPGDDYQGSPRVCCVAPPGSGGSIYRVGTTSAPEMP